MSVIEFSVGWDTRIQKHPETRIESGNLTVLNVASISSHFVTYRFIELLSKRIYENTPVICSIGAVRWQRPETAESLLRLLKSAQQPRAS